MLFEPEERRGGRVHLSGGSCVHPLALAAGSGISQDSGVVLRWMGTVWKLDSIVTAWDHQCMMKYIATWKHRGGRGRAMQERATTIFDPPKATCYLAHLQEVSVKILQKNIIDLQTRVAHTVLNSGILASTSALPRAAQLVLQYLLTARKNIPHCMDN